MTQLERVLAKARGFNGVCQADFAHPVCDGGKPITRVAARLQEAEDRFGCAFECIGTRSRTKVYRLVAGPGVERDTAPPSPGGPRTDPPASGRVSLSAGPDRLFEPSPPASSHYDVEAA